MDEHYSGSCLDKRLFKAGVVYSVCEYKVGAPFTQTVQCLGSADLRDQPNMTWNRQSWVGDRQIVLEEHPDFMTALGKRRNQTIEITLDAAQQAPECIAHQDPHLALT